MQSGITQTNGSPEFPGRFNMNDATLFEIESRVEAIIGPYKECESLYKQCMDEVTYQQDCVDAYENYK